MLTIDWSQAPEWAEYVAMDEDGEWYWFEKKPVLGSSIWRNTLGRSSFYEVIDASWRDSLQQRPVNIMDRKGEE